ncbi:MAG: hypothetical protein JJT76_13030 [Clostridiaceae bacterium]|nr:hypothetical protein [Clostridiaceae bacterium]
MILLANSIKKTLCIAEGWQVGRLIIEGSRAYVELDNGQEVEVEGNIVEIRNDDVWQRLNTSDYKEKTVEGWPLFAGFETRIKQSKEA